MDKIEVDSTSIVCDNLVTEFPKGSSQFVEDEKARKSESEMEVMVEEQGRRRNGHSKLTGSTEDDILKVRAANQKATNGTTAPSFRGNTSNNLCDFILLEEQILKAAKKVKTGKKYRRDRLYPQFDYLRTGSRKLNALGEFFNPEQVKNNLSSICKDIFEEKYQFLPYCGIATLEKGKTKPRTILVPEPRDRVVFTWILEKIKENFYFLDDYNILGSGRRDNLKSFKGIVDSIINNGRNYEFVLKVDIKSFFPSIKRDCLLKELSLLSIDPYILKLIRDSIFNKVHVKDRKFAKFFKDEGVPQGCAYSPLLANFYAKDIDIFLKDREYLAYRYLDDILIFVKDRVRATTLFKLIEKICLSKGLELHPLQVGGNKSFVEKTKNKFEYLGVRFHNLQPTIPPEAKDDMLKYVREKLCSADAIQAVGEPSNLHKGLRSFIYGWQNHYKTLCPDHFESQKELLNKQLLELYSKNSEIKPVLFF